MGSVTDRSTTVDCGVVYAATRARFVALMESLGPDDLVTVVSATPAWTVREAEWDREAPAFEDGLRLFGYSVGAHFVGDLHAHVQDVRAALRLPADRDPLTVRVSLDWYLEAWTESLEGTEAGSVAVVADGERHVVGHGPPIATVTGDAFEILRAISGRRSADQIRALAWSGDREPALAGMSQYPLPEHDLTD